MLNRLILIWTALTGPQSVIDARTVIVTAAYQKYYIESVEYHLQQIKHETWELVGVSLAHSDNLDVSEIQRFLGNAPYIIRNLLDMARGEM